LVGRCSVPSSSRIQTRPIPRGLISIGYKCNEFGYKWSRRRSFTSRKRISACHLRFVSERASRAHAHRPGERYHMTRRTADDCRVYNPCYIRRLPTPCLQPPRLHADVRRCNFGPAWGHTNVIHTLPDGKHQASRGTEPAWGRSRFVGTIVTHDRSRPTEGRGPRSPTVPGNQAGSVSPGNHSGDRPALPTITITASASPAPSRPISPRLSQLSPADRSALPPRPASRLSLRTRLPPSRANGELSPWPTLRPDTVHHHMVYRPITAVELQASRGP
jgi:hypothetical protein